MNKRPFRFLRDGKSEKTTGRTSSLNYVNHMGNSVLTSCQILVKIYGINQNNLTCRFTRCTVDNSHHCPCTSAGVNYKHETPDLHLADQNPAEVAPSQDSLHSH